MRSTDRLWLYDTVERVAATFVMALIPTLYTNLPWFDGDLADPSKIGLALGAALGSLTKAVSARYVGDRDTAAWLPRAADTTEPAPERAVAVPKVEPLAADVPTQSLTSSTISAKADPRAE